MISTRGEREEAKERKEKKKERKKKRAAIGALSAFSPKRRSFLRLARSHFRYSPGQGLEHFMEARCTRREREIRRI
jgi:hypothetical protein